MLVCPLAGKYLAYRANNNLNIHPDALALDICDVKLQPVVEIQVATPMYLPESGDAGDHFQALGMP